MARLVSKIQFNFNKLNLFKLTPDDYTLIKGANVREKGQKFRDIIEFEDGDFGGIGGRGFKINSNDRATDGKVTGIVFEDRGEDLFFMTRTDVPLTKVWKAFSTKNNRDDKKLMADALSGKDNVKLSNFDDNFRGFGGNDRIEGKSGFDTLRGDGGRDTLLGGGQSDRLEGGRGNDRLDGGKADDVLIGGKGRDTFVFGKKSWFDTIRDFNPNRDTIEIDTNKRRVDTWEENGTLVIGHANGNIKVRGFDEDDFSMSWIDFV